MIAAACAGSSAQAAQNPAYRLARQFFKLIGNTKPASCFLPSGSKISAALAAAKDSLEGTSSQSVLQGAEALKGFIAGIEKSGIIEDELRQIVLRSGARQAVRSCLENPLVSSEPLQRAIPHRW
jgi:hypothetical protein